MAQARIAQVVVDAFAGLVLGAVAGAILSTTVARPLLGSGGIFDPLLAWPFGIAGGAAGGVAGSLTGRHARSGREWVGGLAIAALAGALISLPVPLLRPWPEHVAPFGEMLRWDDIVPVGGVYGLASGAAIAWLNRPRKRRTPPDGRGTVPGPTSTRPSAEDN